MKVFLFFSIKKVLFLMFTSERGRERTSWGGAKRDMGTEDLKPALQTAESPMWGSNSRITRSCPEPKPDTQPAEQPRCPRTCF